MRQTTVIAVFISIALSGCWVKTGGGEFLSDNKQKVNYLNHEWNVVQITDHDEYFNGDSRDWIVKSKKIYLVNESKKIKMSLDERILFKQKGGNYKNFDLAYLSAGYLMKKNADLYIILRQELAKSRDYKNSYIRLTDCGVSGRFKYETSKNFYLPDKISNFDQYPKGVIYAAKYSPSKKLFYVDYTIYFSGAPSSLSDEEIKSGDIAEYNLQPFVCD